MEQCYRRTETLLSSGFGVYKKKFHRIFGVTVKEDRKNLLRIFFVHPIFRCQMGLTFTITMFYIIMPFGHTAKPARGVAAFSGYEVMRINGLILVIPPKLSTISTSIQRNQFATIKREVTK